MFENESNPYAAPRSGAEERVEVADRMPGITRSVYAGTLFVVMIPLLGLVWITQHSLETGFFAVPLLFGFCGFIALAAATGARCRNIGWQEAWGVAIAIPIVNVFLVMRCLSLPTGAGETKSMDVVGRCIEFLLALAVFGLLAMWFWIPAV